MATLLAAANGNLTDAATWKLCSVVGLLDSQAGSTALTTGNLDSTAFVLEANEIDGFAVKLASRATGSPANTITLTLRNSTAGTNVWSVTLNVSDLNACSSTATTASEGGWYLITGAAHTPNGTDSYVVRATLSATTTAVSLWTNGTANNWSHLVRRTTTAAPVAGDIMHICAEWTAAATKTDRTVTMNSTAATDYGVAVTNITLPALSVNKGGTLAYGVTAATNYVLRLSGHLVVYSGGTFTIGTVASPIPRDSTAVLEFDLAANGDFSLRACNGSTVTMQGLSRTSGKNVVWTLLTANLAAAGTSATVADDTGWLSGDEVVFAPTSQTSTHVDLVTLNTGAGASSLAWTGGVTYAHAGSLTEPMQAEAILLTRNVRVRSTLSSVYTYFYVQPTATVDVDWVDFRYCGYATNPGVYIFTGTGGSCALSYCCFRDSSIYAIYLSGTAGTGVVTIEHCVAYRVGITLSSQAGFVHVASGSSNANHTFNDLVGVQCVGVINEMFNFVEMEGVITNLRAAGATRAGIKLGHPNGSDLSSLHTKTLGPFLAHSNDGAGVVVDGQIRYATFEPITLWRNGGNGSMEINGFQRQCRYKQIRSWGGGSYNCYFTGSHDIVIDDLQLAKDSGFAQGYNGFGFGNGITHHRVRVLKGDFGTASGTKAALTSDIVLANLTVVDLTFNNCLFTAATLISTSVPFGQPGSLLKFSRFNRTAGSHRTYCGQGSLFVETTTFDVTPSLKMVPNSATAKLESAAGVRGRGFLVPVDSGQTVTVTVKVRKDATYNGNAPRLMLASNSALGVDLDTVGDTLSVAHSTWETLTYTTGAASDAGVFEFFVDCDGTAGAVFVDTWTAA